MNSAPGSYQVQSWMRRDWNRRKYGTRRRGIPENSRSKSETAGHPLPAGADFAFEAAAGGGQSEEGFEAELAIDPANAAAEFMLGDIARQAQQWDEAIAHFSRAIKSDPGFEKHI